MNEVRAAIDRLDLEVLFLLGKRLRFIEAAARIKQERSEVRDDARKAQVLENVRSAALIAQVPGELAAALFELLVDHSIAYELERFDLRSAALYGRTSRAESGQEN